MWRHQCRYGVCNEYKYFSHYCAIHKRWQCLPLYKISVLLKTGGADRFIVTRKVNVVIQASLERFDRERGD